MEYNESSTPTMLSFKCFNTPSVPLESIWQSTVKGPVIEAIIGIFLSSYSSCRIFVAFPIIGKRALFIKSADMSISSNSSKGVSIISDEISSLIFRSHPMASASKFKSNGRTMLSNPTCSCPIDAILAISSAL